MEEEEQILRHLTRETWYWRAKFLVGEALQAQSESGYDGEGGASSALQEVESLLAESGINSELASIVYTLLRKPTPTAPAQATLIADQMPAWHPPTRGAGAAEPIETYSFIRASTTSWWSKIFKRVNQISKQFQVPVSTSRPPPSGRNTTATVIIEKIEMAPLTIDMFLYDSRDLLFQLQQVRNPNYSPAGTGAEASRHVANELMDSWGTINVQFVTPTTAQLRVQLADLGAEYPQVGLDDVDVDVNEDEGTLSHHVADERQRTGTAILKEKSGSALAATQFVRRGCPNGIRPMLWRRVLCPVDNDEERLRYDQLVDEVVRYDLLTDKLTVAETKRLASFDDNFFVFEDLIKQTLLAFSRDGTVMDDLHCPRPRTPKGQVKVKGRKGAPNNGGNERSSTGLASVGGGSGFGGGGSAKEVQYPPSGVLPFLGMGYYVAPLCFVYAEPSEVYAVFRSLYTRYFCKLHSINSHPEGLLRLCLLFEQLLQRHQPHLFLHLQTIGVEPLEIALPWIVTGFGDALPPTEVLLLWDRVIGFDSLVVVPILAAAIFSFRRAALFEATSAKRAVKILSDCAELKVVPLLQFCLFIKNDGN